MLNKKISNVLTTDNPLREMNEAGRNFFSDPFSFFGGRSLSDFRTDIKDEGNAYLLEADLPGFAKEDINLIVNNNELTISAVRHSEHEEKDSQGKYICCERSYGSYSRQFDVSDIKAAEIHAKYDNGVLTLEMPKKECALPQSRKLEIE